MKFHGVDMQGKLQIQRASDVGALSADVGRLAYDTTNDEVVIGDGSSFSALLDGASAGSGFVFEDPFEPMVISGLETTIGTGGANTATDVDVAAGTAYNEANRVETSSTTTLAVTNTGSAHTEYVSVDSSGSLVISTSSRSSTDLPIADVSVNADGTVASVTDARDLDFDIKTSGTVRLEIDSVGNVNVPNGNFSISSGDVDVSGSVAIGLTNPDVPLHVSGDVRVGGSGLLDAGDVQVESAFPSVFLKETDVTDNNSLLVNSAGIFNVQSRDDSGVQTSIPLKVDMSAPTDSLVVNASGFVGFGTNSPSEELEIESADPVIRLTDSDGGFAQIVGSNGDLRFDSDNGQSVASSSISFRVDSALELTLEPSISTFEGGVDVKGVLFVNSDEVTGSRGRLGEIARWSPDNAPGDFLVYAPPPQAGISNTSLAWNAEYNDNLLQWESISSGEEHAIIEFSGGSNSLNTAMSLAVASSNASAGDPVSWDSMHLTSGNEGLEVGINTDTPAAALDVRRSGGAGSHVVMIQETSGTDNYGTLELRSSSFDGVGINFASSGGLAWNIASRPGEAERFTITDANGDRAIVADQGSPASVGIGGNSTTGRVLQVHGNAEIHGPLQITDVIQGTLGNGDGEVLRVGGSSSDYTFHIQGGHGRIATAWNAYFDQSTSTWRSIAGSEAHSIIGQSNNIPGGGFSSIVLAVANSNASAGDAITWDTVTIDTGPVMGIGTESPSTDLHLVNSTSPEIRLEGGNSSAGQLAGNLSYYALNSNSAVHSYASIAVAIDDDTAGTEDGEILFAPFVAGSGTTVMSIANGVKIGSPAGGYQGTGTLNANAVYDDGSILTDFVFDKYFDGQVREEDQELHGDYEFTPLKTMVHEIEDNRSLPAMPDRKEWKESKSSLGDLVSRLWQAVEEQAIYISELHARLQAVEAHS